MPDGQPRGRIVVCSGDGIHATRADALDDAIAQPGGRRLRSLDDAAPEWRGSLTIVRFWHTADMLNALTNVRFWGQSGQ